MKTRFSLKLLLIVVTLSVPLSYWRTRPLAAARGFKKAVEARNFAMADEYWSDPEMREIWGRGKSYYVSQATVDFEDDAADVFFGQSHHGWLTLEYRS